MSEQIAGHAAAGDGGIETPSAGAALRNVGRDGPVLEEVGAVVEDLTEVAAIDELLREGDGGNAAVVIPDHVGHTGSFDGSDHGVTFAGIHGERFFTHHDLAGLGGGERDFGMHIVRGGDVDQINVIAFDELAPIGFSGLVAPGFGEGFGVGLIAAAGGFEHGVEFTGEEVADFTKCIGMGATHEATSDHTDVECFHNGRKLGVILS